LTSVPGWSRRKLRRKGRGAGSRQGHGARTRAGRHSGELRDTWPDPDRHHWWQAHRRDAPGDNQGHSARAARQRRGRRRDLSVPRFRPVRLRHGRRHRRERRHAHPRLSGSRSAGPHPKGGNQMETSGGIARPLSNVSLADRAYRIRRNALRMGEVQGQGYIAQALDVADILAVSYFHALRYRPEDPEWEGRDRFLLSIGHYAIALYAALIEANIIPEDELETYGSDDSRLPMSGMAAYTPGMEMTGGSLGQGLALAVGFCLGLKRKKSDAFVYCLFSDGECGEGSIWEGAW